MIFNPVERGVREYDVKAAVQFNSPRVHAYKLQVRKLFVIVMSAGELDHLARTIQTHDPSARKRSRYLGGDLAIARADIQHRFIASELEPGNQFTRPGELGRRVFRVLFWIPLVNVRFALGDRGLHVRSQLIRLEMVSERCCSSKALQPFLRPASWSFQSSTSHAS